MSTLRPFPASHPLHAHVLRPNPRPAAGHRRIRAPQGGALRAADAHLLHRGPAVPGAIRGRTAVGRVGRSATWVRRHGHRHRPSGRRTRGRLLRHPVQVLRARHHHQQGASGFLHLGVRPGAVHQPPVRGYRRHLGAERPQDHRRPDAGLQRAALRRLGRTAIRLAGSDPKRARGSRTQACGIQPPATSAGRLRRRDRRFPRKRPGQAGDGLRHRQDLHCAAHRRGGGRHWRPGLVSRALDCPVRPGHARVGQPAGTAASLPRRVFGHPRRR